jgi:hypothetical protein
MRFLYLVFIILAITYRCHHILMELVLMKLTPSQKHLWIYSQSYLPIYWQGCFWGGKVPAALAMIDELEARVNRDLENDIVALWHDETHINKYFMKENLMFIPLVPEYAYP